MNKYTFYWLCLLLSIPITSQAMLRNVTLHGPCQMLSGMRKAGQVVNLKIDIDAHKSLIDKMDKEIRRTTRILQTSKPYDKLALKYTDSGYLLQLCMRRHLELLHKKADHELAIKKHEQEIEELTQPNTQK